MPKIDQYYYGLVIIDIENEINSDDKKMIITEFAKKMYEESSIVLVASSEDSDDQWLKKFSVSLKDNIGARINRINFNFSKDKKVILDEKEIATDIVELLTKFKNTTGATINSDGGCIEFEQDGKTKGMHTGEFYRCIHRYFKKLTKESYLWCASTMLEDEWTEDPLEMNFRVINLEAANRGVKMDRIFIFSKEKIKEFQHNKTLKVYMQSNINTYFVDYDEILEKKPELLKIVGAGWDGIDTTTLIADIANGTSERGYISINEREVKRAYDCFQELMRYAKDLKKVLK